MVTAEVTGLVNEVLDRRHHCRLLIKTGDVGTALAEVAAAVVLVERAAQPAALSGLARLALYGQELTVWANRIPVRLPAVWVQLGEVARAEVQVRSVVDAYRRADTAVEATRALARSGRRDVAVRLAVEGEAAARLVEQWSRREGALVRVASAWAATGEIAEAERVVAQLSEQRRAQGLAAVAGGAARAGALDQAERLAERAETAAAAFPLARAWAYATLVRAWILAGQPERAEGLCSELTAAVGERVHGLVTVARAWDDAGREDRAEGAREAALTAVAAGVKPAAAAAALVEIAGAWAEADQLERAEAAAAEVEREARDVRRPNSQVWAAFTAVKGWAAACAVEHAEAIARSIPEPGWRASAFTTVARAWETAGRPDLADAVAGEIDPAAWRATAFTELAMDAATGGRWGRLDAQTPAADAVSASRLERTRRRALAAESAVRAPVEAADLADAVAAVTRGWLAAGQPEQAERVAGWVQQRTHLPVLIEVSAAWAAAGRPDRADVVARTIAVPPQAAKALRAVALAWADQGEFERAEQAAKATPAWPHRPRALAEVAEQCAAAGQLEWAARFAEKAEVAARASSPERQGYALPAVAAAWVTAGEWERAMTVARSIPAGPPQPWAFAEIAKASARAGRPADAIAAAEAAQAAAGAADADSRAPALTDAARAWKAAGRLDTAEQLIRSAADPFWQASALTSLLHDIGDRPGPVDDAHYDALADAAHAAAKAIRNPDFIDEALAYLTRVLATTGRLERAEEVARTITDSHWRGDGMGDLGTALVDAGHLDRAEALVESITEPDDAGSLSRVVATATAAAGHLDRAASIAAAVTDPRQQAQALVAVADAAIATDTPASRCIATRLIAAVLATSHWTLAVPSLARLDRTAFTTLDAHLTTALTP